MKHFSIYCCLLCIALTAASCKSKGGKSLITPTSSGRPYEVLVVADDQTWIPTDSSLYRVLDTDVPALPQSERSFRISRVRPAYFDRIMRIFRNVVVVDIQDIYTQTKFKFVRDAYASPQIILTIQSPSKAAFDEYLEKHGQVIVDFFTKVEMNRQIEYFKKSHNQVLSEKVKKLFDCDIWMPTEMKSFKVGEQFLWASSELNDVNFVMYTYPFRDNRTFTKDFFIHKRDSVMRANLPGEKPDMYMQTADSIWVETKNLSIKGDYAFEVRGLWEMKNDAMGGPFVSQVRIDRKNGRVVVVEGFVYNPGKLKRDLVRKLNAALYTLQLPEQTEVDAIPMGQEFREEKVVQKATNNDKPSTNR